jgi:hypothetical protein
MTDASQPTRRAPRWRWLVVLGVFVLIVAAITVAIALAVAQPQGGKAAPTDAAMTPGSTASGSPTGTTKPTGEADPLIPADCAKIYTKDWAPEMNGLALNPEWTADPASGVRYGSRDTGLVTVLEATTKVTCVWADPRGGGDTGGLTTNVARLTADQEASVREHLSSSGYTCYDELKGTRCVSEVVDDNGTVGESHFLREGVWLATWWLNIAPDGYTHDIVAALWGNSGV